MGNTLLIGHAGVSWREWLKANRGDDDLLCLDPADPNHGTPARFSLIRGSRPIWTRFHGSLDAQRSPHVLIAALAESLNHLERPTFVQLFPYRPTPLLRQTVQLVSAVLRPDRIVIAEGTKIDQSGFLIGPENPTLEPAFPAMVQQAQRKAQWMKLLEQCESHVLDLRDVTIEGVRFGSGDPIGIQERLRVGLESAHYAEICGPMLFVVTDEELSEGVIARALDLTHTSRATLTTPAAYENLLCSFARQSGEEFGMGIIDRIDWEGRLVYALNTAVAPVPVQVLRLGTQRIDRNGNELPEARAWGI